MRKRIVAVIGAGEADADLLEQAERVGEAVARAGFCLACGGLGGVMEGAARGAHRENGLVLGIVPTVEGDSANRHCDLVVATGMGVARNVILVASADAVVALGGGSGTLSELALAWQLGKPIVAMHLSGGWAARLSGERLDQRTREPILVATTADEALALISSRLGDRQE